VAEVLVEPGPVLLDLGRNGDAEAALDRARTIVERAYSRDHPAPIAILENQARVSGSDQAGLLARADQIRACAVSAASSRDSQTRRLSVNPAV
jgi:hypothetical protein